MRQAERDHLLDEFGRRIEAIVAWSEQIRALPVLVIPSNESGYEPNRSVLPASVSQEERRAFTRDYLAARSMESEPGPAMARYRPLIVRHPEFAESYFRLGRLLERSGEYVEAGRDYRLAIDLDGFPQRCPTRFQNVYRPAARHDCILIDGPAGARPTDPPRDCWRLLDQRRPSSRPSRARGAGGGGPSRAGRSPDVRLVPRPRLPSINLGRMLRSTSVSTTAIGRKSARMWPRFTRLASQIRYDPTERLLKASLYARAAAARWSRARDPLTLASRASDLPGPRRIEPVSAFSHGWTTCGPGHHPNPRLSD